MPTRLPSRCSMSRGKRPRPRAICGCIGRAGTVNHPSCSMSTSPVGRRNIRRSFWRAFPGISTRTATRATTSCRKANREPSEAGRGWKGGARKRTQFSTQAETESSGLCDDALLGPRPKEVRRNAQCPAVGQAEGHCSAHRARILQ